MIKKVFAVSIIAATVALAGCSSDDDDDDSAMTPVDMGGDTDGDMPMTPIDTGMGNNLVDALTNDMGETEMVGASLSRFDTLLTAATAADLGGTLSNVANTFTVFAPVDSAFGMVPEEDLTALLADTAELTNTLLYHVAARPEGFVLEAGPLAAVAGGNLTITEVDCRRRNACRR